MPPRMRYEDVKHLMDAAGIPAPGRVRRKPGRKAGPARDPMPPAPVDDERRPGVVICEGTVYGRAVPWKSPTIDREGRTIPTRDYKRYVGWIHLVAAAADAIMARRRCYGGPVRLDTTFYLRPDGRTVADTDNLRKAFADALQGVCYANDRQVAGGLIWREMTATERERVEFTVTAL